MPQHAPGAYFGRPIAFMTEESGERRTPCLTITFDVTHRAANGEWVSLPNPEQRDVRLYLSENAWPYTEAKLKSIGFNGDFERPDFSAEFKNGAELVCKHELYDNRTLEKWDLAGGGAEKMPASKDIVRTLNARWKTGNAASSRPAGSPAAPPPPGSSIVSRQTVKGPGPAAPAPSGQPSVPAPAGAVDNDEPPF